MTRRLLVTSQQASLSTEMAVGLLVAGKPGEQAVRVVVIEGIVQEVDDEGRLGPPEHLQFLMEADSFHTIAEASIAFLGPMLAEDQADGGQVEGIED